MSNTLNTLGLCKKAGKLIAGFDAVIAGIGKAAGIIVASDLSEKSKKEVAFHCKKHGKPFCTIKETMDETEKILGKRTGIIAVTDDGLFNKIIGR
ncbi:MAG: 50S ribosomal protein L7 [Oscillospiraceae bacterium]|nr:50S ribosomal protein L7 [Oscillospiraceae bacterium]